MTAIRERTRTHNRAQDHGFTAIWVAITIPALLLMLMLIVDGAARLKAGEQADTYAGEAARAASIVLGPTPAGGSLDTRAAAAAANAYLVSSGAAGTVTVIGPGVVTVRVTVTRTGPISGVRFTATRTATARVLIGVEKGQSP